MNRNGILTGISVSHQRANVDEIEAASYGCPRELVESLLARDGVDEAFALQTCNRSEAYVVTDDVETGRRALEGFAPTVRDGAILRMGHEESIRHLMRVAAGLESLVLGEDQIIGQFREAVEDARGVGGVDTILEEALLKAIHVGERARTETAINEGTVSLGSAAVELARREDAVEGAVGLVVGAGEIGTLAARALADAGAERVIVANRTVPHAEHVAGNLDVPARAVSIDEASAAVEVADVVITATAASGYILEVNDLSDAGETLVIDIAKPRDVDPDAGELAGLTVEDIDTLEAVTEHARRRREEEAMRVERLIDAEFDRLLDTYKRKRADAAISRMYENAERLKQRELEEALTKMEAQGELTEEQRETMGAMADALVGKLLAAPTRSLRDAAAEDDWATIQTAMGLFNPEFDAPPLRPTAPRKPDGVDGGTFEDADPSTGIAERPTDE